MSNISTNSAATKPTDDNLPIGAKALAALRAECRRKVEKAMNAKEESFEVWAHHYCVATLQSRLVDCLSTKAPRLLAREAAHAAPPIKTLTCLRKRIAGWAEQERRAAAKATKAAGKNSFAKPQKPDPVGDKIAKDIEAGRERLRKRAKTAAAKPPAADGAVGNFAVKLHGSAAKKARAVAAAIADEMDTAAAHGAAKPGGAKGITSAARKAAKKAPPAPPTDPKAIAKQIADEAIASAKADKFGRPEGRPCLKDARWQCTCPPFSACLRGTGNKTGGKNLAQIAQMSEREFKIREDAAKQLAPKTKAAKPAKKGKKK